MKIPARDLLVVSNMGNNDHDTPESEIESLNALLNEVEKTGNCALVTDIFDLNRYQIIRSKAAVEKHLQQRRLKPFIFIFNNN